MLGLDYNVRQLRPDGESRPLVQLFQNIQREYTERNPRKARIYEIEDMIIYRAHGVLSPAERELVAKDQGGQIVRELMVKQWVELKAVIRSRIQNLKGVRVLGITVDISPEEDELIIVSRLEV